MMIDVRRFGKDDLIQLAIVVLSLLIDLARSLESSSTSPLLSALVPQIQQDEYQLTPEGNKYHLRIDHPVGDFRNETVELKSPGTPEQELTVNGVVKTLYPASGLKLTVIYEAGRNGYRAKFKLERVPVTDVIVEDFVGPGFLKSAAG